MDRPLIMRNTIQEYAWGSPDLIPRLLGLPNPERIPKAELWMGAHPKAPSEVIVDGRAQPLDALIDRRPVPVLGHAATRFGNRLPFLFKLLAAGQPLSIQAHPSIAQAREGFERENRAGIPLDAPHRNYRDANHKPEILCALTRFWALCGFRAPHTIGRFLAEICPETLAKPRRELEQGQPLRDFFAGLLALEPAMRDAIIAEALPRAEARRHDAPEYDWVARIHRHYPNDIGILAPAILNLIQLQPGEAIFTEAGVMHAYLEGLGIELMANSDNVLRGGLTAKHIDIPELLRVVRFDRYTLETVPRITTPGGHTRYDCPAAEFALSRVSISAPTPRRCHPGVAILVCVEGCATVSADHADIPLTPGHSLLVPANVSYALAGLADIFVATVPADDAAPPGAVASQKGMALVPRGRAVPF